MLQSWWSQGREYESIPCSRFEQDLSAGLVEEVVVQGDYITGTYREPRASGKSRFITTRVPPDLYSRYERTIYRKPCRRCPNIATEAEIDELFDPSRAVDLHGLVKKHTEWPTRDHSIKALVKYPGFHWRDTDPSAPLHPRFTHRHCEERSDEAIHIALSAAAARSAVFDPRAHATKFGVFNGRFGYIGFRNTREAPPSCRAEQTRGTGSRHVQVEEISRRRPDGWPAWRC